MPSPDGTLYLIAPRRPGDGFAPALVLAEIKALNATLMAVSTGYITPRPTDLVQSLRKQIVVAVTIDGNVVVFDHNLKVLWKQSLQSHMPDEGKLEEVSILITEHGVTKADKGLIVIGARAEPDTLADDVEEDDFLEEEILAEGLERIHTAGRKRRAKLREVGGDGGASGRHFSYFAFNGGNGQLKWKHEALDFHRDLAGLQETTVSTQHSLHTAAQLQEGIHYGEASCRDYRESILAALPHSWFSERDTYLELGHFHRHRAHRGAQKERIGAAGATFRQLQETTTTTTDNKKHFSAPNVIVSHLAEGIEAVHLFSGRTVCRLFLDPYVLHVDLNGDGIPDHVHAIGGHPADLIDEAAEEDADEIHSHSRVRFCAALVTSGIPPRQHLFNGTICKPLKYGLERTKGLGTVEVAAPVALPVPGKGGHYRQQTMRQKSNAVVLNNRGEVSAYSSSGELL